MTEKAGAKFHRTGRYEHNDSTLLVQDAFIHKNVYTFGRCSGTDGIVLCLLIGVVT